jgi:nucleotide-binding universal stress UspA family protein
MNPIGHILVPTDFEDAAEQALDVAIELATAFGADITLMHVFSVPSPAYAEGLRWPIEELEPAARRALADGLAKAQKRFPKVRSLFLSGSPWQMIVDAPKEHAIDLIVMGTHGRRGVTRWWLGSEAERVVRMSPVPVLTISSGGKEHDALP